MIVSIGCLVSFRAFNFLQCLLTAFATIYHLYSTHNMLSVEQNIETGGGESCTKDSGLQLSQMASGTHFPCQNVLGQSFT